MRLILEQDGAAYDVGETELLVGSSARCSLRIPEAAQEHARIGSDYIEAIEDCVVGGVRLGAGRRRLLAPDCTIDIQGVRLVVEDEAVSIAALSTRAAAFQLTGDGPRYPTVFIAEGAEPGAAISICPHEVVIIGRHLAEGRLFVRDESVSRAHAEVSWDPARGVLVRDAGSTRGSRLGRHRLQPRAWAVWGSGKMLLVGESVLALEVPPIMRAQLARALEHAPADPPKAPQSEPLPVVAKEDEPAEPAPPEHEGLGPVLTVATPVVDVEGAPVTAITSAPPAPRPNAAARARRERLLIGAAYAILILLALVIAAWLAAELIRTKTGTARTEIPRGEKA